MQTNNRKGFTLIELLIVVVIIGILAAIAIPKFRTSKGKANATSIKSDLHNLAVAQESYMYEMRTYATATNQLAYNRTEGVVLTIQEATASGWAATATHPAAYPLTCGLFVGNVASVWPARDEGVINCE